MKKVIIPVLVLALLGGGWYFMKGKGGPAGIGGSIKDEAFKGGLAAAVKLGVPMKCSYSIGGELDSEGYIKGKNYRGKATVENGKVSEVLMKDECMWNWDEETKEGTKLCFSEGEEDSIWGDFGDSDTEELDTMEAPEGYSAPDIEYDCKPAVISDAIFTPPTDVKFLDMAEVFDSFMPEGTEGFGGGSTNLDDWK